MVRFLVINKSWSDRQIEIAELKGYQKGYKNGVFVGLRTYARKSLKEISQLLSIPVEVLQEWEKEWRSEI